MSEAPKTDKPIAEGIEHGPHQVPFDWQHDKAGYTRHKQIEAINDAHRGGHISYVDSIKAAAPIRKAQDEVRRRREEEADYWQEQETQEDPLAGDVDKFVPQDSVPDPLDHNARIDEQRHGRL